MLQSKTCHSHLTRAPFFLQRVRVRKDPTCYIAAVERGAPMFDWLRKGKRERPEESEAYKLGQQAFQSMAADLEVFVESRFNPTFHATLNVKGVL